MVAKRTPTPLNRSILSADPRPQPVAVITVTLIIFRSSLVMNKSSIRLLPPFAGSFILLITVLITVVAASTCIISRQSQEAPPLRNGQPHFQLCRSHLRPRLPFDVS